MTSRAMKNLVELGTALVALAMMGHIVLNPNSAKLIQEIGEAQKRMIKVALGERIIAARDIPRFETLLGTIDDTTMTELLAGLTEADLDWVSAMLGDV